MLLVFYFRMLCMLLTCGGVCLFIGLLSISAIKVTLLLSVFEIRNCSINFAMNSYLLQQLQLCWKLFPNRHAFPEQARVSRTGTLFQNRHAFPELQHFSRTGTGALFPVELKTRPSKPARPCVVHNTHMCMWTHYLISTWDTLVYIL